MNLAGALLNPSNDIRFSASISLVNSGDDPLCSAAIRALKAIRSAFSAARGHPSDCRPIAPRACEGAPQTYLPSPATRLSVPARRFSMSVISTAVRNPAMTPLTDAPSSGVISPAATAAVTSASAAVASEVEA